MNINEITRKQHEFFASGKTFDIQYRKEMLVKLRAAVVKYEKRIAAALKEDLGKSETEGYMCEIGLALEEISFMISHVAKLAAPKRKRTPIVNFHAKSFIVNEPYGCVLIMSPWNYPFLLCIQPLAGAIAAGNCALLKPSAYSPATSAVIKEMIGEIFDPEYVAVIEGGRAENQALLDERFDYIFFTGGVNVGKQVMEKASRYLTPVTLELGGKSPCIVDKDCNIKRAARRIAFGKYLNCGQTCVAPDYLLIHKDVKKTFLSELSVQIKAMFTEEPLSARDYGKIINEKHFNRILGLIDPQKVVFGGHSDAQRLKIEPTVMDGITRADAVMQEEIFGPILPILQVDSLDEAIAFVRERPKPLALYLFTRSRAVERQVLGRLCFGGGCVNDTVVHLATPRMPFGGVGNSGMGRCHGKAGFDTFTHEKSILKKGRLDLPVRYPPYGAKRISTLKKLM